MAGFSHLAGNTAGMLPDYFNWSRTVDGVSATTTEYATTVAANDARDWIALQTKPWLMWLAFNAGHAPDHVPPRALHTYGALAGPPYPARPIEHYHGMIEAMDTEYSAGARNGKVIRDAAFKLIRFDGGAIELYDLRTDPYEAINLMASPLSPEAEAHLGRPARCARRPARAPVRPRFSFLKVRFAVRAFAKAKSRRA